MAKKLVYVINHMDWFWTHRLPLAVGAQNDGWDVSVCAKGARDDHQLSEHGFTGIDLPDAGAKLSPLALLGIIFAVRKMVKRERPNMVHAITLKYAFITGLACLGLKVKVVHTLAGLGYLFSGEGVKPSILRTLVGPFLKLALKRRKTQLIFQNPDDREIMLKRNFAHKQKCHLIRGSGVDMNQFAFTPEPKADLPLVLMPTRLVHDKGIQVFIDAAKVLALRGIDARFEIAGGEAPHNPRGIKRAEMERMVKESPVRWLGKVSGMPALLATSNLIVYPSYYGEGIPKVLLEAASTGRAIITTDHAGCREAVDDGENGFLVPIKDVEATADAIEKALRDDKLRVAMGRASRIKAEAEFDVNLIVKMTLCVYNSASVS